MKRSEGKVSALILEGVVSGGGGVASQSHRVRSLHRLERVGLLPRDQRVGSFPRDQREGHCPEITV